MPAASAPRTLKAPPRSAQGCALRDGAPPLAPLPSHVEVAANPSVASASEASAVAAPSALRAIGSAHERCAAGGGKRRRHPAGLASCPSSRNRHCGERAPPSAALRLADGCRRPLRHRLGRVHRAHGAAHDVGVRPAVERDRRRTEPRSRQPGGARGRHARDLEQHHAVVAGRRVAGAARGRAVGTSGV